MEIKNAQTKVAGDPIMTTKQLYEMKLFEVYYIDHNTLIRRVPGGWVYGDLQGCCFVPLSNEVLTESCD